MKLVYEPRKKEAERVAERTRKDSEDERGPYGTDENVVFEEHGVEILKTDKFRRKVRHVKVSKTDRKRHDYRNYREKQEENHKRKKHEVAHRVTLHLVPCVRPLFLKGHPALVRQQNFLFLSFSSQR